MHAFIYVYLRIGEIGTCKAMGCFRFMSSEFRERKRIRYSRAADLVFPAHIQSGSSSCPPDSQES